MSPQDLERKLTAILSADVAGYSRLMGDDVEATVRTLTDHRRAMSGLIQQYKGRVVDSPGDNLLAEFVSVVDALSCAVEIQQQLAKRNAELPVDRKMEFRIGVNLGDVVTEGERIYGDGVNIAARLESLAEPGGICISGSVYGQVKNRLKLEYESLGEQEVKNIQEPVPVYRVFMKYEAVESSPAEKKATSKISGKFLPEGTKDFELPEGPSIAVLPFVNMSGDPEQEYFSDGLTENIIAGLSCNGRLLVIARNSTFAYKGKSVQVQEMAQKLRAQYVVEGSVQKAKDRVRITVQLIDANTGHHVWSDRYDRELKDIFALQDEITMKIMTAVGMKLVHGEQFGEKFLPPSGSLEVFMKVMKAGEYFWRGNKQGNILARQELEEAISLDPEYAAPYSMFAMTHVMDLWFQSTESPLISLAQASKNIDKALSLDHGDYVAHIALSQLYWLRKEHDKAIGALERAIVINPNGADAYAILGNHSTLIGKPEEGMKLIEKAIRLNPIPPAQYLFYLGIAFYHLGRYEDAIELFKEVLKGSPDNLLAQIRLTASYSTAGREEEARHQAEKLLRIDPTFSVDKWAEILFIKDQAETERFIGALRKAGLN